MHNHKFIFCDCEHRKDALCCEMGEECWSWFTVVWFRILLPILISCIL